MSKNSIQRVWWRFLRLLGMEKLSWDKQFEAGIWCRGPRSPETLKRVQELCRGGRLVEFGCGEGTLPFLLPPEAFSSYSGYDISQVAVERAKRRAIKAGATNIQFEQCDMSRWNGTDNVSLILAEECLYYLTACDTERFLVQCSKSLTREGSILVIVHSASKHSETLSVCRHVCRVHDEASVGGRAFLTLTPRAS